MRYLLSLAALLACLFFHIPTVRSSVLPSSGLGYAHPDVRFSRIVKDDELLVRASSSTFPRLAKASESDVEEARKVVKAAIKEMTVLNKARLDHPARNVYKLQPGTVLGKRASDADGPPILDITPQIASAAALLAEAETAEESENGESKNTTDSTLNKRAGWWMEGVTRRGTVPTAWGGSSGYKVYRDVTTYGADPSGSRDSTAAIMKAMLDGNRCAEKCNGATTKNAIVYFPAGTYLVSSSIEIPFGTQMIGDANSWPTIKASSAFVGLGVLSTNKYIGSIVPGPDGKDAQYYVNTANFYRQIRNFKVDIRATDPGAYVCAIHYQIAQATSLQFVELIADSSTTQQGMFSENGSGGVMADVTFNGGAFGFYGGNQQFSADRMTFKNCKTAVQIIWDWGWVWKSVTIDGADVGFRLIGDDGGNIGSVSFIDSVFSNVGTAVLMAPPSEKAGSGTSGLILDNTRISGSVKDTSGNTITGSGYCNNFVIGPVYKDGKRSWTKGSTANEYKREKTLLGKTKSGLDVAPYFERSKEQYKGRSAGDFKSLKGEGGAKGDGSTDDTSAVQNFFNKYGDGNSIIYVDAGVYMLSDTVVIPRNAKIVGEMWPQFAAFGDKFSDASEPRVMLQVGKEGDEGNVEMQDLILTTKGGTAGAILMEWNVKAESQGSAALWDVHVRIGGATGTKLTHIECPAQQSSPQKECQAASLMFHLKDGASGYFDNMWLWVADHIIDDPDLNDTHNTMIQCSIYVARGFLIESKDATWLYGTSSEHSVMYQYNFHDARNIFTTMIQTEEPYYQPTPKPPAPFASVVGDFVGDPEYDDCDLGGCDEGWAVIVKESENIHIGGAGTYSWFDSYSQDCIDDHACQLALWEVEDNYENVRMQHIISIGARYTMIHEGDSILAMDNLAVEGHPRWSQISIFDATSSGKDPDDKCTEKDNTWKAVGTRTPELFEYKMLESEWISTRAYVTIVNLTPYLFRLDERSSNSYQIDVDFGNIPAGRSRQNVCQYQPGDTPVDSNADQYWDVVDTKADKVLHRFHVKCTTHIPDTYPRRTIIDLAEWGLGYRELNDPHDDVPVTWVITGSEKYGYIHSLDWSASGSEAWMKEHHDAIKERKLRQVLVPGSHDAGVSKIQLPIFGSDANTQTQGINIERQLRAGSRYFDFRVVKYFGKLYMAHINGITEDFIVGAMGETLDEAIGHINSFTDDNPGEVVILWLKELGTVEQVKSLRRWSSDEVDEFWSKMEEINNRCPDLDGPFEEQDVDYFAKQNSGRGCVLIIQQGWLADGTVKRDASRGFYDPSDMGRNDRWSETGDLETLIDDQVSAYPGNDQYLISQWQLTPDLGSAGLYGLSVFASYFSNPALQYSGIMGMSPTGYPSAVLQDWLGVAIPANTGWDDLTPELKVLAVGVNLYLASENCNIDGRRHPLFKDKGTARARKKAPWNGAVFANGTRINQIPEDWEDPYCTKIWPKGTVFGNGTIVRANTTNPAC